MAPFRRALQPAPQVEDVVLHGLDGWLFVWTGNNEVHRLYTDPDRMPDSDIERWAALIEARAQRLGAAGITYRHLVTPEKISIYPEYVPVELPFFDRHPTRRLALRLAANPVYVDLLAPLRGPQSQLAARREAAMQGAAPPDPAPLLYWKTDSHWSNEGCEIGYRALCTSLGVTPRDMLGRPIIEQRDAVLDLGGKLNPRRHETRHLRQILRDARRVADNAIVRDAESPARVGPPKHVGSYVAWRNDVAGADPRRLVIFGDSFANYRTALSVMLAEAFREVHFVWSSALDFNFIDAIAPDIVVAETTERFLVRHPGDRFRVSLG